MKPEKDNVIRGKLKLGENAFPSTREKTEKIMNDIARINKKWTETRKSWKEK